jgi:nitronate monooxygenase
MVQGLIRDVPTVGELIDRIIREAEQILDSRIARLRAHA